MVIMSLTVIAEVLHFDIITFLFSVKNKHWKAQELFQIGAASYCILFSHYITMEKQQSASKNL